MNFHELWAFPTGYVWTFLYHSILFFFFVSSSAADVRPGLLMTHTQQRLHDQMKRKQEREQRDKSNNPKALEEQRRQEGLDRVIDSDNKGYALLQKMGYKPGSGIGKNSKRGSGTAYIGSGGGWLTFVSFCAA